MASYYDFVLAFIPLTLLGVPGVLAGAGLDTAVAVPVGAAVAAVLIGHAMFVRAPTDAPRSSPRPSRVGFQPAD